MLNVKTKCVLVIVVGILIASFLGVATFQPKTHITDSTNNTENSKISNDLHQIDKFLKSSESVPANYEWYRTVAKEYFDEGFGVAIDSLGNAYLGGYVGYDYEYSEDMRLLKYNSTGHVLLDKTWDQGEGDICYDVAVDSQDNVILAGTTNSKGAGLYDFCVVKYNKQGVQLWNKTWGTAKSENGLAVTVDSSGNIYVTGYVVEIGGQEYDNITLVKFNSNGVVQWSNKWGGYPDDKSFAIDLDSEENVIVGGYTKSFGAQDWDTVLIKYDKTNGNRFWNKTWGSANSDDIKDLVLDSEDNIFTVGTTDGFETSPGDMLLVKFNKTGDHVWHRTWGKSNFESGEAIAIDSLNNIYIGGYESEQSLRLVKYDKHGNQLWNESWGSSTACKGIKIDSQKNIYLAGSTSINPGMSADLILLKYNHSRPDLTINAPTLNQIAGKKAPNFDVDVIDPYLNTSWYAINGSSETHEFTGGIIGTVDQDDWNLLENGTVTLQFYANNSAGVENSKEIKIKRDIIDPIILINEPLEEDGFYETPFFNVTVVEPNLKSLEYSIDNGASNWTCSFLGYVWPSLWEAAQYGNVTLRFYAKDKGNNTGYAEVNVTKLQDQAAALLSSNGGGGGGGGGSKEAISGYPLVLVIVAVLSTTILLIKKKLKPKLK